MELDVITGIILELSVQIHRELGPGLLESVYEVVLARELTRRGLSVERQKAITITYQGLVFEEGFRADLWVESKVLVELKSLEKLSPVHTKQLLTYLRLARLPVGLLLNFGSPLLKDGIHRVVNDLAPNLSPHLLVNRRHRSTE